MMAKYSLPGPDVATNFCIEVPYNQFKIVSWYTISDILKFFIERIFRISLCIFTWNVGYNDRDFYQCFV